MKRTGFRFGLPMVLLIAWVATFTTPAQRTMAAEKDTRLFHIRKVDVASVGQGPILSIKTMAMQIPHFERLAAAIEQWQRPNKVLGFRIEEQRLRAEDVRETFDSEAIGPDGTYYLVFGDRNSATRTKHAAIPVTLIAVVDQDLPRTTIVEQTAYCHVDNAMYTVPEKIASQEAAQGRDTVLEVLTMLTYADRGGWNATVRRNTGTEVALNLPAQPLINTVSQK